LFDRIFVQINKIKASMSGTYQKFIQSIHLLTILWVVLMTGCDQKGNGGVKTTVSGSFPALGGKNISIAEIVPGSVIPIDTVKISDKGSFKFKFRREGPGFYIIKSDNKNYVTLILDRENHVEVVSEQNIIRKGYQVKGSPDSELYRDFEMFLEINRDKVDSLSRTYNEFQRSSTFRSLKLELDKTYQDIFAHQRLYSVRFLENHCGSLASLLVIDRRFGERKILLEDKDFKYFLMVDSCLSQKYMGNKHLAEFQKKLETVKQDLKIKEMTEMKLAPGNKIPDISLQDRSGKEIRLHSLAGSPVIIYFWASWDQGSRKFNRQLKSFIEQKRSNKPVVYAISFESYKELWLDAIRNDGIESWINVTDLLNVNSGARTLFNVPDQFPYYILLDKNLTIKYKGNDIRSMATLLEN